jgi:cation diffusion facilitator CzcD-associated flavoprotein CzcO
MQYPSFPMPEDYPHYPHHTLVADYLDAYVDHHRLRDRIECGTEVSSVARDGERWSVELANATAKTFDSVVVASGGRHAERVWAKLPGEFSGRVLHAFDYQRPADFAGERVLVLGLGATAADVSSEISLHAAATYLSARTGHYVVPKLFGGHPIDELSPLMRRISPEMRRPGLTLLLKLVHGEMSAYGLPTPPYKPGQGPLIATSDLLPGIAHGRIHPKPAVAELRGREVLFTDGSQLEFDSIVHCTGYQIAFPFLDRALVAGGADAPPLYNMVVPPEIDGLYFVGLLHSMMALMPLAEAQAEWVGDLLVGSVELPRRSEMWSAIRAHRRKQEKRFYDTSRHLLVEPYEYERLLARERRVHAKADGARRA